MCQQLLFFHSFLYIDASTRIVVAAFWFVVLLGVPFWWKTTEVYRASLPLAEIDTWQTWQASNKKLNKLYDMNSIRTLKYSPRYQVTFSLMNNDPRGISVDWNIRDSMKTYVYPFLDQLSMISNFTMQHYASLSMKPQFKNRADKPSYYYFNPEHLPHFVNSAEWNLASTISSYPTINLILYVPSPEETPLRIHDSKEQPLLTNAFLIPRWGGVVIKNPSKKALAEKQLNFTKKDLQPIMKIFVAQLRSLMGIPNINSMADKMPSTVNATFMSSPITGITTLEKDQLIRHRTVENMVNAIATLHSLQQLVTEIPKMVVLDHIALQVQQSLNALQLACDVLSQGKYTPALQYSIEAIELSEKAFFDPTMVSMLYFPDEHKYAIYMPLFVPISVPLVMALLKEVKNISKQRKEKRNLKVE
ncbi:phosphatidylinositol-glycan biosynthesis class S protein [Phycomyces blakesleeanus]